MKESFYASAIKRLDGIAETNDLYDVLDYAFTAGESYAATNKVLDEAAKSFRDSDKSAKECLALLKLLDELPWELQERFWGDSENEDLKEFLPRNPKEVEELENKVREDVEARGARILERIPKMPEELERVGKLIEDAEGAHSLLQQAEKINDKELAAQLREEKAEADARLAAAADVILSRVKEVVFAESSISEEEAMEWAKSDAVQISDTTFKFMAAPKVAVKTGMIGGRTKYITQTPGPAKEQILNEIATIYRLTNGNLKRLNIVSKKTVGRSYYSHEDQAVHWLDTKIDTLYHEAGHALDHQNKTFVGPAKSFIKNRATGKPVSLNLMLETYVYGRDETAYPDKFINPYVGKIYPDSTEVTSIGLQAFANIAYMRRLMLEDPEHLKLILGTLTSQGSSLPGQDQITKALSLRPARIMTKTTSWYAEWAKVVDEAIEASGFKDKMMNPSGFHGYIVVPNAPKEGSFAVRRRRGMKNLATFSEENTPSAMRFLYLYLAQESGLIPDMRVKFTNWGKDIGNYPARPPEWFTPITQLPRI